MFHGLPNYVLSTQKAIMSRGWTIALWVLGGLSLVPCFCVSSVEINLPQPLEIGGLNSHIPPVEWKDAQHMQCAVAGEREGDTPPQRVENNYLADLSGEADDEAGPVRRSPQGEGGRKAKTLANEGDNPVFGLFEFDFGESWKPPLPPGW